MLFTVVTPTTGHPKLLDLLQSIQRQWVPLNLRDGSITIEHFVVIDGPEFVEKATAILQQVVPSATSTPDDGAVVPVTRYVFPLPLNTGAGGFLGHKIYAGISQWVRGDYVLFLDDDNWWAPTHLYECYRTLTSVSPPLDWCYTLRTVVSFDGTAVCRDNCESLGFLHPVFYADSEYMIDTNCTCVSLSLVQKYGPMWNHVGTNSSDNPDRTYSRRLMSDHPRYDCTYGYTLQYRVANRPQSVSSDMFVVGNRQVAERYGAAPGVFPWSRRPEHDTLATSSWPPSPPPLQRRWVVAHFDRPRTQQLIARLCRPRHERPCVAYHQWQLNLLDALDDDCVLVSAYQPFVPAHSRVVVHMCHPLTLPEWLPLRTDLRRVLYTAEGPNMRHQTQWSAEFLQQRFDTVLTYASVPQLDRRWVRVVPTPFVHRLDFENPNDMEQCIRRNAAPAGSKQVCIVLENRPFNGKYTIQGEELYALDFLRAEYAQHLGQRIDCYGATWQPLCEKVNFVPTKERFLDQEWTIDILQRYRFALIVENCTASGYVSEKIYDAWSAGCIPLYYGNMSVLPAALPNDCFVDIRHIPPAQLPGWLDALDEATIQQYQRSIETKRREVLRAVSVNAYCDLLSGLY
jgi:hypothetical protein